MIRHFLNVDPEILKALQPWKDEADIKGKKQIGTTKVYLHGSETCKKGECNLGNVFTDAMVDYVCTQLHILSFYWKTFDIIFPLKRETLKTRMFNISIK